VHCSSERGVFEGVSQLLMRGGLALALELDDQHGLGVLLVEPVEKAALDPARVRRPVSARR